MGIFGPKTKILRAQKKAKKTFGKNQKSVDIERGFWYSNRALQEQQDFLEPPNPCGATDLKDFDWDAVAGVHLVN